jgi:hypothetical protein
MTSRVSGGLVALTVGLCVAMVAVGFGIGALVWAGDDDSDDASAEPVEAEANAAKDDAADEARPVSGGDGVGEQSDDGSTQVVANAAAGDVPDDDAEGGGVEPNDRPVSIQLYLYTWGGYKTANVTPLWDAWNNCARDANTPGNVSAGPVIGQYAYGTWVPLTVTATGGGVFEDCSYHESRMHWQITLPDGTKFTVQLIAGVGGAGVASCGPQPARNVDCGGPVVGHGNESIAVRIP